MTAPLTVHNAAIHTAAVAINTLTIRGKQVTLAVFRQLQTESLIDDDVSGPSAGMPGKMSWLMVMAVVCAQPLASGRRHRAWLAGRRTPGGPAKSG